MAVYTVHEPPPGRRASGSDPVRIKFVRDGFSFRGFLLGLLIGWPLAALLLGLAGVDMGTSAGTAALIGLLVAVLLGLEAASLRRVLLDANGWKNLGVVVADDRNLAERRFFDAWIGGGAAPGMPPARGAAPPPPGPTRPASHVIGLFPQPGGRA